MKKANMEKDSDWDSLMSKKEQAAKQADRDTEYNNTKDKLDVIGSKMTEQDLRQLESEGFPMESFTIDGLYEALNRVKAGSAVNEDKKSSMTTFDNNELIGRLMAENLPATSENITKLREALTFCSAASGMSDKAMQYLISTNSVLSAENIYQACYTGNAGKQGTTSKLSDQAWSELKSQVKDVIGEAGYEVNEENLKDARWLIENNLPLTADTFTDFKSLKQLQSTDKNALLNKMVEGMKDGINPKDVSLAEENSADPKKMIADIHSISDEAVAQAVREDGNLTIKRLVTIQESLSAQKTKKGTDTSESDPAEEPAQSDAQAENGGTAAGVKDYKYEEIKAKRQLEEIRLKMTLEAANNLEKKGFSIETEQLSKVVDALREQENSYYQNLLKEAGADTSDLSVQTLKETTQSIEQLKFMPNSIF
jgi:hypothetical protein